MIFTKHLHILFAKQNLFVEGAFNFFFIYCFQYAFWLSYSIIDTKLTDKIKVYDIIVTGLGWKYRAHRYQSCSLLYIFLFAVSHS